MQVMLQFIGWTSQELFFFNFRVIKLSFQKVSHNMNLQKVPFQFDFLGREEKSKNEKIPKKKVQVTLQRLWTALKLSFFKLCLVEKVILQYLLTDSSLCSHWGSFNFVVVYFYDDENNTCFFVDCLISFGECMKAITAAPHASYQIRSFANVIC